MVCIAPDGKPTGLIINEKTLRDISQSIATHIEPRIYPQITEEKLDGKTCIKITFSGKEKFYFSYSRAYMRVADEDRHLTAKELENLILARNREALRWDNEPCKISIKELNERKIRAFVKQAGLIWDNAPNVLEKLSLMQDGQLLNAAPLFFAKNPVLQLRCAVFASTDTATIIDRHDFTGDILELIEEAQKYILKNIHIGMKLDGLYRVDVPEISVAAMQEAIINAFCHRDYHDPDYVQIAIFKDRVEIRNPGKLYGNLTIEKIRKGNVSQRRNPLIAELLRRIQMVETWGRGMRLILAEEPTVQFSEEAHLFIAAFNRPSFTEPDKTTDKTATPKEPEKITEESSGKTPGKTPGKIIELLKTNPGLTIPELAEHVGKSKSAVERAVRRLREGGWLKRIGPAKGGHWEVVE